MKKIIIFLVANFIAMNFAFSQGVAINPSGAAPDPSALLDLDSSTSPFLGVLIPRLSETQRNTISNPALGLQIYNTTTDCLNTWTGTAWKENCGKCPFDVP